MGWVPGSDRLKRFFADTGPDGTIPKAPAGDVRLERRFSSARGRDVGLFTAVPQGSGDGRGLPVCLVLHGASATTADFTSFGFSHFLTAAVTEGVTPFVLVGADGGQKRWRSADAADHDDPQRMLIEEVPRWLEDRGFDFTRLAAWGWSMGGYGALLLAEGLGDRLRAAAAFSPAVPGKADGAPATADGRPRDVWAGIDRLAGDRIGVWCGTADSLYPNVKKFVGAMPSEPAIESYARGAHTRGYWNRTTPAAFRFIGDRLER